MSIFIIVIIAVVIAIFVIVGLVTKKKRIEKDKSTPDTRKNSDTVNRNKGL